MGERVTFQTRARTVDHLGRGQIADCPTAVSELWKNAYDAYAQNVSLIIYDGNPIVAAVMDDGFGMTRQDFLDRWLVIGTESKIQEIKIKSADRFGLPERPRLGEKGIGRLSAAFLAPLVLVISKKKDKPFAAAMVDWRLFENPFLALEDINLPVEEFDRAEILHDLLPDMFACLTENLNGSAGPKERTDRLKHGWERFDAYERNEGLVQTTSERIFEINNRPAVSDGHLSEWPVFLGLGDHGTALFMLGVNRELAVWVDPSVGQDDEAVLVRERLKETLTAFTDPYSQGSIPFAYEVLVKGPQGIHKEVGSTDNFGKDDFEALEHFIEGEFDAKGVFTGKVRAFGKDRGSFQMAPSRLLPQKGGVNT